MKLTMEQTCGMFPEQYDVKDEDGMMRGYLRLRHGCFTVTVPDVTGITILAMDAGSYDDAGEFADPVERGIKLNCALAAIDAYWQFKEKLADYEDFESDVRAWAHR